MYYGSVAGAARGYAQGADINRAAATKKAYQEMAKGSASGPRKAKKATQPEEEMQATFYGPNKTQKLLQQISPKDEKEVVKETEGEFKRR